MKTTKEQRALYRETFTHTPMVLSLLEDCDTLESELKVAAEAAMLGLSFAPKGPVTPGLDPTFYHTLNYESEVELQNKIDAAREALAKIRGEK